MCIFAKSEIRPLLIRLTVWLPIEKVLQLQIHLVSYQAELGA